MARWEQVCPLAFLYRRQSLMMDIILFWLLSRVFTCLVPVLVSLGCFSRPSLNVQGMQLARRRYFTVCACKLYPARARKRPLTSDAVT